MIAIIDNGGEYSEHTIHFIKVPDWFARDVLERLVKAREGGRAEVLGVAEHVDWWHGEHASLQSFLGLVSATWMNGRPDGGCYSHLEDRSFDPADLRIAVEAFDVCDSWGDVWPTGPKFPPMPEAFPAMARSALVQAIDKLERGEAAHVGCGGGA